METKILRKNIDFQILDRKFLFYSKRKNNVRLKRYGNADPSSSFD